MNKYGKLVLLAAAPLLIWGCEADQPQDREMPEIDAGGQTPQTDPNAPDVEVGTPQETPVPDVDPDVPQEDEAMEDEPGEPYTL